MRPNKIFKQNHISENTESNEIKCDQDMEELDESTQSLNLDNISIDQPQVEMKDEKDKNKDLDAFQISYSEVEPKPFAALNISNNSDIKDVFKPSCRRSSYIQFYKSNLYVYGGKFEDNEENEITFNDMYYLNIKKMEEWKVIYEDKDIRLEKIKNASISSGNIFI